MNIFKNKLSRVKKFKIIFFIIYILVLIFIGALSYDWLPNEAPNSDVNEILSFHEECDMYNQCGEVADVWRNINTGKIYTPDDFKKHSNNETIKYFMYLLIGIIVYFLFKYYEDKLENKESIEKKKEGMLNYINNLSPHKFPNITSLLFKEKMEMVNKIYDDKEEKYIHMTNKEVIITYEELLKNKQI